MHISVKRLLKAAAILLVLFAYVAGAYAFSQHTSYYNLYSLSKGDRISYDKASVISIDTQQIAPDKTYRNMEVGTQAVTIRMLTGEYKGQEMKLKNGLNYDTNYRLSKGQNIIVSVNTASNGAAINIFLYSPNREPWLYVLIGLFVLSLCAIGGRKGFKSVVGIVFTLTSVMFVFIPLLYRGASPALAALVMAGVTACVTLLLTGGWEIKTFSAILGTFISVAFSAGILRLSEFLLSLSGYNMPEYDTLIAISGHSGLRVDELLFASIIIASLGAVMDIAISIASSVNEVFISNPHANVKTLFRSGMNVGRDMMGTMANTLILAFTGSSLNMLILIYAYKMQYLQIMNSNTIAIEIVTALSGSLAVIFTVPLVSLIAAKFLSIYFNVGHKSSVPLELPAQESTTEVHME
jgi:uncharacterized membrane protein